MEDKKKLFDSTYFAAYNLGEGESAADRMSLATDELAASTPSLRNLSFAGHNLASALGEGKTDFFTGKTLSSISFNGADLTSVDFSDVRADKLFMLGVETGPPIIAQAKGWPKLKEIKASENEGKGVVCDTEDLKSMVLAGHLDQKELYELYADMKNTAAYLKTQQSPSIASSGNQTTPAQRAATLERICNLDFFSAAKQRYNEERGHSDLERIA